jgi:hypothetical protein
VGGAAASNAIGGRNPFLVGASFIELYLKLARWRNLGIKAQPVVASQRHAREWMAAKWWTNEDIHAVAKKSQSIN